MKNTPDDYKWLREDALITGKTEMFYKRLKNASFGV